MSEFIQNPERGVELPLDCKDLIDIDEIRYWTPVAHPDWPPRTTDKLAYIEGYLARLLQTAGESPLVFLSCNQERGQVMVIRDPDPVGPAVFASCNGAAQEQVLRAIFEEAGMLPITGPVGRWKGKCSLIYPLPVDPSMAARFIGEVFRAGYGLGDLASISFLARPLNKPPP